MCGIIGALVFDTGSFRVTESYIEKMRDAMFHRGPDGAGCWVSSNQVVGLGHRRLSIIDLSPSASQPLHSEDGRYHIVFNGEIYNHVELRKLLISEGITRWQTDHSDTEVVINAFAVWGSSCVNRFIGMFAIAIWDSFQKELWLFRDRVGIKPLYYSIHHERIVFASEIKALLLDPEQRRETNEQAIGHYLSLLTTPAPETMFRGIKKLKPGTWMRVQSDGCIQKIQYWDPLLQAEDHSSITEHEAAELIHYRLMESVRWRGVSDVPVGIFLSGGIDSSTNAALFAKTTKSAVQTFTVGYDGDYGSYRNEDEFARLMSNEIGSDHHEIRLNINDLMDFLPQMIHLQDEPIGDPVCVPLFYLSKLAKDSGVTVCQVGEGADELFWGYPTWRLKLWLSRINRLPVPTALKKLFLNILSTTNARSSRPYEALRRAAHHQPIFWGGVDCFTEAEKLTLFSDQMREVYRANDTWSVIEPFWTRFQQHSRSHSLLQWMSYIDLSIRLPELLLMRVDKMTMGASLEGRVPFLDHSLVSLALGLPEHLQTKNNNLKHLLKTAVRGTIPNELIDRKKQGFGVPIFEWVHEKLGRTISHELHHFCDTTHYFKRDAIDNLLERRDPKQLWYILNLALWHRYWIEGDNLREIL